MNNEELLREYKTTTDETRLEEIKEIMITTNKGMILKEVKKYGYREDYYQEACYMLLKCMDIFNPDKGMKFSTYFSVSLKRWLFRHSISLDRMIPVPVHHYEDFVNRPEPHTIHMYVEKDEFVDKFGDVKYKSDSLKSYTHPEQEQFFLLEDIKKVITDKTKLEIFILHVYYGYTAESLLDRFKISRQRIHQIKSECIEKIRTMEGYAKW